MNTPWGFSQSQETLAEGVVSYSTSSHGGIWLSDERVKQLPAGLDNFLHDLRWWEEDCDWSVPYTYFAHEIEQYGRAYKFAENLAVARETAKRFYPILNSKV